MRWSWAASLAYLLALPIDVLKIDRVFIERRHHQRPLVRADAVDCELLARALTCAVAKGIERSGEQVELLQKLHCDAGQGFYFARPLMLRS